MTSPTDCPPSKWLSVAAALMVVMACCYAAAAEEEVHDLHVLFRSKRQVTCAAKFQINPGHTACMGGSSASAVSAADQQEIVNVHNQFRSGANPPASNMLLLRWDDEVAMIAQKWADTCKGGHDQDRNIPGRFSVGQNVAQGTRTWRDAVTLWHSEVKDFVLGDNSMNSKLHLIGHYTAIMWANTTLVGCGSQTCKGSVLYVCNYAAAGNMGSRLHEPYKRGTSCADCPGHCSNGLCDCQRTCLNGGTLDTKTCQCKCQQPAPLYIAPDCSLNCTGTEDAGWCAAQAVCPDHAVWCPHKCRYCPYAGVGYDGPPPSGAPERVWGSLHYLTCVLVVITGVVSHLGQ